jgi:LDH2 family malate/lactate/ureidoglycolate dehydrogenase
VRVRDHKENLVPRLNHNQLRNFTESLLSTGGMPPDDAKLVAKLLVKADLRGYPGHGVTRVAPYLKWIKDGTINLRERPRVVQEGKITAVIEGNHYIGQAAAHMAMQLAIKKAKEHGAGVVTVRRASHSGRLADYMEMAADAGLIAMGAVSVGSGTTTLYGGMERIIGTHPMAFGIPARNGRHIILDFATASMSMGEIQKRVAKKEPIPDDVMLDGHGNPTNDFKALLGPPRGVFLPFGGYKGSGVALITEILGGLLTGNGLAKNWWDKGGHGINGIFLQAIAVEEFQPLDEFLDRVDELIAFVRSRKTAPGFKEILLPGEQGRKNEERQMRDGVEIDEATWTEVKKVASELGINELPQSI